jgi:RHS repeat-associated protein
MISPTSVATVTDAGGQVLSGQEYDPWTWGKVRSGGIGQTTLNYTGQRLDSTGLVYYHARYYDPNLGRFFSADLTVSDGSPYSYRNTTLTAGFYKTESIIALQRYNTSANLKGDPSALKIRYGPQNPQALNRYAYVEGNPLRYIDPTGHGKKDPGNSASGGGGAVGGGGAGSGSGGGTGGSGRYIPAPGEWTIANESMSARARSYQSRITNRPLEVYMVRGVKFDGYDESRG